MKSKVIKKGLFVKVLMLVLILAMSGIFVVPALTATNTAKEITSDYLFEKSTFDDLKLNFSSMPTISVSGVNSSQYKITDNNQLWYWTDKQVKNRRIEFNSLDFNKHYPNLKLTVTYNNCGTLNGKNVDIVLTYSDFYTAPKTGNDRYDTKTLWWTAYGTPQQQNGDNEWFMVGFSKFNFDIKLRDHQTGSFISIDNAYFTLYSMDGNTDSSGDLYHSEAASSSTASAVYWYNTRNLAYKSSYNSGSFTINNMYYGAKSHSTDRDTKNALCYQYKNVNSINIDMFVAYGAWSEGYHVNFTPLTAVVPNAPVKTVSPTSTTANSDVIYTIKQEVPFSYDTSFKLNSLRIEDTLDNSLEYSSATIKDSSNKDITSAAGTLNFDKSTNKLTFTFDKDYLADMDYNGSIITLTIQVRTTGNISDKVLTNKATTYVNDNSIELTSNPVQLGIYYPVTAQYVDENGTTLADSVTKDYNVGEEYQTSEKDIANYKLLRVEGDETGIINDSPVTVKYVYVLKDTSVTANYKDESGQKIAESETINGKVLDHYQTTEKSIYGYELTKTPTNATGTMTEAPITVDYIYRLKDAKVTVKWVDDSGKDLATSQNITGKVFDQYNTEEKTFYGYRLTATPENASGTMTEEPITVTYVYTKKQATVTANYLNENRKSIADPQVLTGKVGDTYTTEQKDIYGYQFKEVEGNTTGTYTEDNIVVNYIYSLKDTSVLVKYVTDTGTTLTDNITINGKVFDPYSTESKQFTGYTLSSLPDNASGNMTEDQITVTYVYTLNKASVVAKYVDEDGNEIASSETVNGNYFDSYKTTAKDIYGYELTETPANATGTMNQDLITVTYVYRLKDAVVEVNYIDEKNNPLAPSTTLNGKVFDDYKVTAKDIYGYALISKQDTVSGQMKEEKTVIDFVYRLKDGTVNIHYVDEQGNKLSDDISLTGKVFSDYTTSKKNIYGYYLSGQPDNANGQFKDGVIDVTYIYSLYDTSVVVSYITEDGKQLCEPEKIEGKVFDEYSTSAKDFYGYEVKTVPANANGTMTQATIYVKWIYQLKDSSVIVNYVDTQGNKLTESVKLTGKVFDPYTSTEKTFDEYDLTSKPENASGTFTEDTIEVNYVYDLKPAQVTIRYIDQDGQPITNNIELSGKVRDPYSSESKTFYGYELTAVPENASGKMTPEDITVDYIYRLKTSSVQVNYLDENGDPIEKSITINGNVFDKYQSEQKDIYGYTLTSVPENASGTITEEPITVNYIYRLKDTSVTARYTDEEGNPLNEDIVINGKVFDEYKTETKEFYGYTLTEAPKNATGTMTETPITVNYVYALKPAVVNVSYVNENGDELAEPITLNGKVFDEYNTSGKTIYGYELIAQPDNASGTMTEEPIAVNYVYKLKDASVTAHYTDEKGNPLNDDILISGKVFDKYETEAKEVYGYELAEAPENASGTMTEEPIDVNYVYKLKDASVVVNYVDKSGNALADAVQINGKVFDEYNTEEKDIKGYKLTAAPDNAKGTMTEEPITVTYVYEQIPEPEIPYTGQSPIIYGIAGGAVVLIAAGITLICFKKKSKKQ